MGGYIGAKTGTLVASASDIRGDISATDTTPEITLKNTTETDADGTRSGKITFKGEQSGGEESVLAQIQGSHDGTADDEKGDLIFKTNDGNDASSPTERVRINSAGDVLVSSPDPSLTITNTTEEDTDGGRESTIVFKGEQSGGELSTLAEIEASHDGTADDEKGELIFRTNDGSDGSSPTEAARIDSKSNLLIGHSDNTDVAGHEAGLQIVGQGTADYHGSTISIIGNANNANGAYLNFAKTRSNTAGSFTAASAGDVVGEINFSAADGTDLANRIGYIQAKVNDNVASNDTAGRFEFATTAQGSGTPATRLRIDVDGIKFGSDSAAVNGLNDYEEGTWTPILAGSTSTSGQSYTQQHGTYTKIGDLVHVNGYCSVASIGTLTGTYAYISGLPFSIKNNNGAYASVNFGYHSNLGQNVNSLHGYANVNTSFVYVTYQSGASVSSSYLSPAGWGTPTVIFSITYLTS